MTTYAAYLGKTPVQVFEKVELLGADGSKLGTETVHLTLASQFITNKGTFLFYSDRGTTWKLLQD